MSTGYDEDGSVASLICAPPSVPCMPTIFCGMGTQGWTPFSFAPGAADFSIECYSRAIQPSDQDNSHDLGLLDIAMISFDLNSDFNISYSGHTSVELCPDPTCAVDFWDSKGIGWSHDAGNDEFDCDGSQVANTDLTEGGICISGVSYLVQFEIKNYVAGLLRGVCGTQTGPWWSGDGVKSSIIAANGTDFIIQGNSTFNGSVDNISITGRTIYIYDSFGGDKKWHHLCANYDRNANMELFIDGVSQATFGLPDAGSPVNIGSTEFRPCVISSISPGATENANAAFAAIAMHAQLLDRDQMLDSIRKESVQRLSTTFCAYDWRGMRGHTDWEYDTSDQTGLGDYIIHEGLALARENAAENVACPIGVNGDVIVPDLSGNNRDLLYWTAPAYTIAVPGRSIFIPDSRFK